MTPNRFLSLFGSLSADAYVRFQEEVARIRAEEHRLRVRDALGCCPCGEYRGRERCPWCDDGFPEFLRPRRTTPKEVAEKLAELGCANVAGLTAESPRAWKSNRFERRRAASLARRSSRTFENTASGKRFPEGVTPKNTREGSS